MYIYFPAVKGKQGDFDYYSIQVRFGDLSGSFVFDDTSLPLELRVQRELNVKRARKFTQYMLDNASSFVTGAVLGSVDKEVEFIPLEGPFANGDIGMLKVPADKRIILCDGQHRQSGISMGLEEGTLDKSNTLPIILYIADTVERKQQIFTDVNNNQVKPATSLSMTFDHRNDFLNFVKDLCKKVPEIKNSIEFERNSVGSKSIKLWPLVSFKSFLQNLTNLNERNFDQSITDQATRENLMALIIKFIKGLDNLTLWKDMIGKRVNAAELRSDYIVSHAVFLEALGYYGAHLLQHMESIQKADWSLMNALSAVPVDKASYVGRCVSNQGTIVKNAFGIKSTAAMICEIAGIPLSDELKEAQSKVFTPQPGSDAA